MGETFLNPNQTTKARKCFSLNHFETFLVLTLPRRITSGDVLSDSVFFISFSPLVRGQVKFVFFKCNQLKWITCEMFFTHKKVSIFSVKLIYFYNLFI
jgi:hypothetical protein